MGLGDSPTIIVGHLNDEELKTSIDSLVAHVSKKTKEMVDNFDTSIESMKRKLKELGSVKVDVNAPQSSATGSGKNSPAVDASTQRTAAQKKETAATKETALTYDQLELALKRAQKVVNDFASKKTFTTEDLDKYTAALTKVAELRERLNQSRAGVAMTNALANEKTWAFDAKKINEMGRQSDELKKLNRLYAEQEKLSQKATQDEERQRQKRVAAMEKESAAQKKMIDDQYKLSFARTMKIPTDQLDLAQAKLERLQALLRDMRKRGILSNTQIASTEAEIRKLEQIIGQVNTAQQQTTQSAQRYTEEVRKQAAAIRATEVWQKEGFADVNGHVFYDPERLRGTKQHIREIGTLEEQILRSMQQQSVAERATTQEAQQHLDTIKRVAAEARAEMKQYGTSVYDTGYALQNRFVYAENDARAKGLTIEQQIEQILKEQTKEYERQSEKIQQTTQKREKRAAQDVDKSFKTTLAQTLGVNADEINSTGTSIKNLTAYSKQLQQAWERLSFAGRTSPFGKQLKEELQLTQLQLQRVRNEASRPISLNFVRGMSEKTLDDITYKIRQLQSYKRGIDLTDPKQIAELKQVDAAINRLQKDLNKYMSTTKQATELNKALARSWNYMKNRLAFYFTVGASTQFVKNLIDIRSQYEMNERALGILINSAERGTQIFNELSQMALVSPYTLIELSTAAKQLTAYDIAARDVVDTTRRLADMAAAVGIPIDRLTYALGQIKAYGYLNARDARMFSNAGIPLVKQLSDYYTELEGRMVSVADVYDRIKKKTIDFNTVMSVMYKMTDEGGKFFDFQAKMADTLKVRLANLTLAWNNMLNDMGKETQGLISFSIDLLKKLFLHWKQVDHALKQVGAIVGLRFAVMLLGNALLKAGVKPLQRFAASLTLTNIAGKRLAMVLTTMGKSLAALLMSPTTWIMVAVMWFAELASAIWNANQATEEFNKNLRDSAKTTYDELAKFLGEDVNVRMRTELDKGDISPTEASKAWENVREQIELSSRNSEEFVQHLLSIQNESERLRQGFALLDKVSAVNAALKDMDDTTIKITQDWSKWWNLWRGADGLVGNLDDYVESLKKYQEYHKSGLRDSYDKKFWKDQQDDLETLKKDVDALTESIDKFISLKGWSGDIDKINEAYSKIIGNVVEQNQISPEKAFRLQLITEEARANAAKKALSIRIEDEKNALAKAADENAKIEIQARLNALNEEYVHFAENNGRGKVLWEEYTTWLKEQHISETREMFRGMDAEEIAKIDFSKGKWKEFAETTANKFAREHNLATDDVFTLLNNWVKNANKWSIFIPLVISSEGDKSLYDTLKEYDSQIDKADGEIDRLNKRIDKLNKKPLVQRTADEQKELARAQKERDEAQKARDEALAKGGISKKDEKEAQKDAKKAAADARKRERAAAAARRQEETELQKTLKDELSLIDKIRSTYKDLTKEGMSHADAVNLATDGYEKTVEEINKVFAKWGIEAFDPKKFAGVANPAEIMTMLSSQLERIQATGRAKPSEIKDLEVKIKSLNVDAKKYDLTKITKGLNSELDKLKDEYELAVELDANPELGGMFMDMFGIDTDALPQTFREVFDKANSLIKEGMKKRNIDTTGFDILRSDLTPTDGKWMGLDTESPFYQTITKWQKTLRDMFQKNMEETEKMLDDYVQKYGDYSDKIASVEADRLLKLKKLNETYYSDEMKSLPEYLAKLNAIEKGAAREKGQIKFDEFKNSRLYIEMFENLDYVSTATLETLRKKLDDLKSEMGSLSPEQLKQVTEQFEKIDTELMSRNPFKGFAKNMKNYAKTMGKAGKDAQKEFVRAQENYDTQLGIVTLLKEQLEQKKAAHPTDEEGIAIILETLEVEEEKLQKLKEELDTAEALNNQYNIMKMLFGQQADAIAKFVQAIAANLEALTELRDTLEQTFSIDFGARINGTVDSLSKFGQGLNQIVSSAQGGNVVGVVTGAVNTVAGFGDTIASIFGDGAARTKRLNREIERSQKTVRDLNNAYKELERQVDKSLGSAETKARRLAITNKEAELAELERQLSLEQRKRSKDRDNDAIEDYKERIQDLKYEIADLRETLVNELLGSDIKSAAEEFVDAWVEAWKAGETTLDAIEEKMDSMIFNLIKKAATSKIVANLLKPLYDAVDQYTTEGSEGGVALTPQEIKNLTDLSKKLDVDINNALGAYYGNLKSIGAIGDTGVQLSALQQGIQGITEDQAGALEAYWNANTQQQYVHTDLLTQIRDTIIGFDLDVQTANIGQILLQLQASYQVQMSIQSILEGVLNPSGRAFNVELLS